MTEIVSAPHRAPPGFTLPFPGPPTSTVSSTDPTTLLTRISSSASSTSSQTPLPSDKQFTVSGGLPIGAIIGIVVGVLVLFIGAILLRALLFRHKSLKSDIGSPHYNDHLLLASSAREPFQHKRPQLQEEKRPQTQVGSMSYPSQWRRTSWRRRK